MTPIVAFALQPWKKGAHLGSMVVGDPYPVLEGLPACPVAVRHVPRLVEERERLALLVAFVAEPVGPRVVRLEEVEVVVAGETPVRGGPEDRCADHGREHREVAPEAFAGVLAPDRGLVEDLRVVPELVALREDALQDAKALEGEGVVFGGVEPHEERATEPELEQGVEDLRGLGER